jgi:hypothetical protein
VNPILVWVPSQYGLLAEPPHRHSAAFWARSMVRPVPGFLWGTARQEAQQPVNGSLHFAHSDLGGLALFEEANWHGVRAAEAVLRGLGRDVTSWL